MTQPFKNVEYKVGFFVLACIVTAIGLIGYIGFKKELFSEKVYYFITTSSGENIERGIPVRLSGFNIGQVTDVDLEEAGEIQIKIRILKKYMRWFKTDAKIVMDREGFIGNSYLKLIPGNPESPIRQPGSVFTLDSQARNVSELIAEAKPAIEDLRKIVQNVRVITAMVANEDGTVNQILQNVNAMSAKLNSKDSVFEYLTNDKRSVRRVDTILKELEGASSNLNSLITNASTAGGSVSDAAVGAKELIVEIRNLLTEIRPMLDNLKEVSYELKGATKDLDRLRHQGEQTLILSKDVLYRLKHTWPLGGKPDDTPLPDMPAP